MLLAGLPITDGNAQEITVAVLEAVTSTVEVIDILDIIGLPVFASAPPVPGPERGGHGRLLRGHRLRDRRGVGYVG